VVICAGVLALTINAADWPPFVRHAHTIHPKTERRPIIVPGQDGASTPFNGWRIARGTSLEPAICCSAARSVRRQGPCPPTPGSARTWFI